MRRQTALAVPAQITQGAAGLGILLVVRQATGSLALGGLVAGAFGLGAAVARPLQGRLIDREGPRRVLVACGLAHAAALVVLAALDPLDAPGAAFLVPGFAAGLALPPVSATLRIAWGPLSEGEPTAAYSLVTLTQVVTSLLGPLLVSVLVALASKVAALAAAGLLAGAGTLLLAAALPRALRPPPDRSGSPAVLRAPAMRVALGVQVLVGIVIGALDVGAVALAGHHGSAALSGVLLAVTSAGGIVGGLWYGARRWSVSPRARLVAILAFLALALAPLVAVTGLVAAGVLLAVAGMALNPAVTTAILVADRSLGRRAAEGFGWLSTASAGGTAAGSALGGVAGTHNASGPVFAVCVGAAAAGSLLALAARRWLGRPRPISGR